MRQASVILTSAAVAAAVSLGAYRLGRTQGSPGHEQPRSAEAADQSPSTDGNAQLADSVGKLERRLAAVELAQLLAKAAAPGTAAAPPGPDPHAAPPDPEEMKRRLAEKAEAIETALRTEPRDRDWAPRAETQVRTAVDAAVSEGAKYALKSLKCMTTVCEFVLSASGADQLTGADIQLASAISDLGSMDIPPAVTAADGSATVTYRMFRKGYPRPDEGT